MTPVLGDAITTAFTMKNNAHKKLLRIARRQGFKPTAMGQNGHYIAIYAGVSPRVAKLVNTEAAIHNKSVASMLNDILEARYVNVR